MKKAKETTDEADILGRLQERVEKAITAIQELRRERDSLRTKLNEAEAKLRDQNDASERLASLEDDCERFQRERDEVRNRIESILSNLESLDA
jgi:FtsZ-binding cell division protein ZapB